MKRSILVIILSILGSSSFLIAQELTKNQMLADYDQLISFIENFAVHKDLNAIRLGINYDSSYMQLRKKIKKGIDPCEFRKILYRASFLVQDAHCSPMPYDYLSQWGKYQIKYNFEDEELYEEVKKFEEDCSKSLEKIHLPITYLQGKYLFYTDFVYKNYKFQMGDEIRAINQEAIHDFIRKHSDRLWPIKWDANNQNLFYTEFYHAADSTFELTINQKAYQFHLKDSVNILNPLISNLSYGYQQISKVKFFENAELLYIGLPMMDLALSQKIIQQIDSLHHIQGDFQKIVIDIRGNPGGTDVAWRNILKHIINHEISFETNLKYKYNVEALQKYQDNNEDIKAEEINLLDKKLYWTKTDEFNQLIPDESSIQHSGNIYILQDEYIYSSAGNFSNFCLNDEQLISVGTRPVLTGGIQTNPLFIKLNHSGLVFRVEPMLDFTNVNTIEDFMHSVVEVEIKEDLESYISRRTYQGDLFSQAYLLNHDPLMKYIFGIQD